MGREATWGILVSALATVVPVSKPHPRHCLVLYKKYLLTLLAKVVPMSSIHNNLNISKSTNSLNALGTHSIKWLDALFQKNEWSKSFDGSLFISSSKLGGLEKTQHKVLAKQFRLSHLRQHNHPVPSFSSHAWTGMFGITLEC